MRDTRRSHEQPTSVVKQACVNDVRVRDHWVDSDGGSDALQIKLWLAHSVIGVEKHECAAICD